MIAANDTVFTFRSYNVLNMSLVFANLFAAHTELTLTKGTNLHPYPY